MKFKSVKKGNFTVPLMLVNIMLTMKIVVEIISLFTFLTYIEIMCLLDINRTFFIGNGMFLL